MKKSIEYETPEIEFTKFELTRNIMKDPFGTGNNDGDGDDVVIGGPSETTHDGGDLFG